LALQHCAHNRLTMCKVDETCGTWQMPLDLALINAFLLPMALHFWEALSQPST